MLGAITALAGPVSFIRLLGLLALLGSIAGAVVQVSAMRIFAPSALAPLRARLAPRPTPVGLERGLVRTG